MGSEERIHWYRSPISKEMLAELTQKQNWPGLCQVFGQLLLSIVTGMTVFFTYRYLSWPFLVFVIYIHGMFYAMLGPPAAVHELSHRTVFKTRLLNDIFYFIVSFLSWTNGVMFRASHMKHHQLTTYWGQDYEVVLPNIIKPWQWFFYFTLNVLDMFGIKGRGRFNGISLIVRHSLGITKGHWEETLFPTTQDRRKLFNWARIVMAGHLILAGLFIYYDLWIMLFIVTFAPFIGTWFSLLFTITQHTGLKPNVPDFRICCRTILLNRFLRYIYWNMNYHIEHHMYAAVPFHNLPKLHAVLETDLPKAKVGLIRTWKEMVGILVKQLKDPDYCVIPEVSNPRME